MRSTGLIVVAVFVAMGLAVAVAFLPLLIALGLLAALGVLCFHDEDPRLASPRSGCTRGRLAMIVGVAVVVGGYAVIGMTALLGGTAAALAGAAVLAAFGLRQLQLRPVRHDDSGTVTGRPPEYRSAQAGTTSAGMVPADPAALSIDDLCRAWRVSYLLVQKARGPDELEHTVGLRRRYLDELARRDPEGFRRWLDDGARAGSDPSRYVGHCSDRTDRDEDEAA